MQVDRIRSFETDSVDPARARGNGKSPGFSELMDSVLGSADEGRAARNEPGDARSERTYADRPSRDAREGTDVARRAKRGSEREAAGADETAARKGAAEREEEAAAAAGREPGEEREEDAAGTREAGAESELVVAAGPQMLETAVPLAIPVFEGSARGSEAEAVVDDAILALAPDLELADDAGRPVGAGALAVPPGDEVAEATNGRWAISDPGAREALRGATQQALAGGDTTQAADEETGDPAAAPASAVESETAQRVFASTEGPVQRTEGAPRAEIAAALRPIAAEPNGARSQSDPGGGDGGRGRDAALARPAAVATPSANAESGAVAAAAVEGATAGLVEAVANADESSGAVRLEGAGAAPAARAPELPPALQTPRALPSAAPDAIAVQAEWLATRGGGTARLVLNPPELGEIAIRVTVRQQAVEVVMVAQTALAHSMAEDQGDRLSQAFASRDLRLDQFEVRRGDPSDSNGTGQFGSSDAGARERERAQDERGVDRRRASGRGAGGAAGIGGIAAPPPRVGSNGGAAGVDLRI